uniref:ARID DNA-binding domain-containing protein n=1 Tax=Tanacetum cinerariifolium TaxID=118510 RepID=A0A699H6F9_TANCI|nr:ARID DNA-binding domain-containing protein [Tanacetum cinerariifolium]
MLHPSTSTLSDQPSSSRTSLHQFSSSFHLNQDDEDEHEDEDEDEIDEESKEVEIVDEYGSILRVQKMTAKDVYKLTEGEKVLVHINDSFQLIKGAAGVCTRFMTILLSKPNLCPPEAKDWREIKARCGTLLLGELQGLMKETGTESGTSIRTLEGIIGREIFCIPPDVTLNILYADQLEAQGMDMAFKNNKCRLVYMFKDPENYKFDESNMKMIQNKYLSDYYKLLEGKPDYEEGNSEKETILTQKCYRCEEIRHYAYACPTKTATVGYIPKGGDYVYVKGVFYPTKVSSFNEYVSFLYLIKNDDLVSQEWDIFGEKFNNAFRWFYDVYLKKEMPGPIPPKINGIEIHLMDLIKVSGLSYDYGKEIKECYNKYLDVFKCYYSTARVPQLEQESVQKKATIFVDQGKELTCLQSHCGDQKDQVTAPIGQDRICQEKNRVEHFGIKLEDIEKTKKCNKHQATYQMKIKDHFEKGSTHIAAKKDERDTSSSSIDDFIIIS